MAEPMLALPSAERPRRPHLPTIAAAFGGAGVLTGFGALMAAWVNLHHFNHPWPPKGVHLVNYPGTMLAVTAMLAVVTAHWAVWAVRRDLRGQAGAGLGFTIGFVLAFVNLLWFFGRDLHIGAMSSPFAVIIYAVLGAAGAAAVAGVMAMVAALVRVLGRQDPVATLETAMASAIYWDFVTVGWLLVTVFVWRPISL
jgi:heme/copper-type cytochrome/quinol oxidase subunit 3